MKELGRLTPVDDLRSAFRKEDKHFTRWLADENLDLLGDALGIELELDSTQASVGALRADIVATNTIDGTKVVIENQLDDSDHDHIGKAITYAAGLSASTVVWIAKRFSDEHRAALDWLNKATNVDTRFIGLEVKLWKIEESKTAVQLVVVSQPNDWSRQPPPPPGPTEQTNMDFWSGVATVLNEKASNVRPTNPRRDALALYAIGRAKFQLKASFSKLKGHVAVALTIQGEDARAFGTLLAQQKQKIHDELGYEIEWTLPDGQQKSTILTSHYRDVQPENREQWPELHLWIAERLGDFHQVFRERIESLDARDFDPAAANPDS